MGFGFDLPDGCLVRSAFLAAVLILFTIAAYVLAAAAGLDLLALMNNTPLHPLANGQGGPAGPGTGVGGGGPLSGPPAQISNRWFTSGSAQASVSGAFSFSGSIAIDTEASYVQDDLAWISFIDPTDPAAGEVLVVFNEPENSVTVAQGLTHAIGQDAACQFDVQVTESSVGGSITCPSVDVLDGAEKTGTASISLQFSTTSVPMAGGDDGSPDETTPADQ